MELSGNAPHKKKNRRRKKIGKLQLQAKKLNDAKNKLKSDKIDDNSTEQTEEPKLDQINDKKRKREETEVENTDGDEKSKKKSKKKKKPVSSEGVPESQMSKRQLKRERHAQRVAEAEEASHKSVQMQALSYLSLWKYNRAEWKFNKVKQIWLNKHKFESDKVPDELWEAFIEYFGSASDSMRKMLLEDGQKIVEDSEKEDKNAKPSETAYKRARDLLQNIH